MMNSSIKLFTLAIYVINPNNNYDFMSLARVQINCGDNHWNAAYFDWKLYHYKIIIPIKWL